MRWSDRWEAKAQEGELKAQTEGKSNWREVQRAAEKQAAEMKIENGKGGENDDKHEGHLSRKVESCCVNNLDLQRAGNQEHISWDHLTTAALKGPFQDTFFY